MDAFFASVEQRDNPELRGVPVAVGGESERGVVAAASYEARKYGVHSAMSSKVARQKCPALHFVKSRFDVYRQVSHQIMTIFHDYTDLIEPLSLDEAFLDVTSNKAGISSATLIAKEVKARIKMETNLTASAGVSINKFLAKIASDYDKPDGLYIIRPENAEQFVEDLPVEKFFGVGKVTAKKMHQLGIYKGIDLKSLSRGELVRHFGKTGNFYYDIARAVDERPVNPERERKSVGAERTFEADLYSEFQLIAELYHIEKELMERLKKNKFFGKTLTLKIKFADFRQITRSKTLHNKLDNFELLHKTAKWLLTTQQLSGEKIRLLGLSVSNTEEPDNPEAIQLTLDL